MPDVLHVVVVLQQVDEFLHILQILLAGEGDVILGNHFHLRAGEGVTLPSYDELKGNFSFAESNFKNVTTQGNSFSADVVSPSNFYGSTVNVQNMKVTVEYTETAFSKMVITYQTANSTVTTTYEFAV